MLSLERIIFTNFKSIENATVEVDKQGLCVVLGKNLDDTLSINNGAGKSTFLAGICWGLFGKLPSDEPVDAVLPFYNPKNCSIKLHLKSGDAKICVERYRKHKEFANSLRVFINENPIPAATDEKMQQELDKLIGFDFDTFCLLLTTSSLTESFMYMKDKDRKEFLDFILNLDYLAKAQLNVREDIKVKERAKTKLENDVQSITSFVASYNADVEKNIAAKDAYQVNKQKQIEEITANMNNLAKTINALRVDCNNIAVQRNALNLTEPVKPNTVELDKQIAASQNIIADLKTKYEVLAYELSNLQKAYTDILKMTVADVSDFTDELRNDEYEKQIGKSTKALAENLNAIWQKETEIQNKEKEPYTISPEHNAASITYSKQTVDILAKIAIVNNEIFNAEQKIIQMSALKTTICPTCSQEVSVNHVLKHKAELEKLIENKRAEIIQLSAENDNLKLQYEKEVEKCKQLFISTKENDIIRLKSELQNLTNDTATLNETDAKIQAEYTTYKNNMKQRILDRNKEQTVYNIKEIEEKKAANVIDSHNEKEILTKLSNDKILITEKYDNAMQQYYVVKQQYNDLTIAYTERKGKYDVEMQNYKNLEERLNAVKADVNPYEAFIQELVEKINKLNADIKTYGNDIAVLNQELERLYIWEQGFGNKGVKSFILDAVTVLLNTKANSCLAKLSNDYSLNFVTQVALKNGDMSDKFDVEIWQKGVNTPRTFKSLSKGEKVRVAIACNYALQLLASNYKNMKLNFEFYDEVFDGLDATGCESIINFLRDRLKDYNSIFVVSHSAELKQHFDRCLLAIKHNDRTQYNMEG